MSSLNDHPLGRFELLDGGDEPLPPPATLKARSLLAYLIVHRQWPHPRGRLAGEF